MNNLIVLVIFGIISGIIIAGFLAGYLAVYVFNKMPAAWLADYGETPDESLMGIRIAKRPYALVLSVVFVMAFVFLAIQYDGPFYTIPGMLILWLLMLIGISDYKYMIIPDQLVLALAVAALGIIGLDFSALSGVLPADPYFHQSYASPFLGALVGGGSIWLIGAIGSFLTKKEAMGFGDVKLLAAIGFLCGLRGILIVLVITIFTSGIWFILLLLTKKIKRGDNKPLGPYIVCACALYLMFRDQINQIVNWYIGLY